MCSSRQRFQNQTHDQNKKLRGEGFDLPGTSRGWTNRNGRNWKKVQETYGGCSARKKKKKSGRLPRLRLAVAFRALRLDRWREHRRGNCRCLVTYSLSREFLGAVLFGLQRMRNSTVNARDSQFILVQALDCGRVTALRSVSVSLCVGLIVL